MSRNREIAEAFAAQFDPPLAVVQTQRVNNVPHRDAWMCAVWDEAAGYGITAHAFGGQLHAYVEAMGSDDRVVSIGRTMAAAMGRLRQDGNSTEQHDGQADDQSVGTAPPSG